MRVDIQCKRASNNISEPPFKPPACVFETPENLNWVEYSFKCKLEGAGMVCDCCLHTSNIIIRAAHTHIGWWTLLTPLLLNHSDIHFLFSPPTPPQGLKPHVIVQHHCTSVPLFPPSCRLPPLLGTVDSWLTKINSLGVRGIHLDCCFRRGLLVIYLFTGTNPCSYSQHALTLVITSWAAFHWKTSAFDTIAQPVEQKLVSKKWTRQLETVPKEVCHKFSFQDPRGFLGSSCPIMRCSQITSFSVTFHSPDRNKRAAGNSFGRKPVAVCRSGGALRTCIYQRVGLIFTPWIHTFSGWQLKRLMIYSCMRGARARPNMHGANLIFSSTVNPYQSTLLP